MCLSKLNAQPQTVPINEGHLHEEASKGKLKEKGKKSKEKGQKTSIEADEGKTQYFTLPPLVRTESTGVH
ncbi:hypothetical protein DXG01_008541 [Tephrocybe rancida]|nr:hypothetical protein DXG01_008541 [Tephrocybe rancida]